MPRPRRRHQPRVVRRLEVATSSKVRARVARAVRVVAALPRLGEFGERARHLRRANAASSLSSCLPEKDTFPRARPAPQPAVDDRPSFRDERASGACLRSRGEQPPQRAPAAPARELLLVPVHLDVQNSPRGCPWPPPYRGMQTFRSSKARPRAPPPGAPVPVAVEAVRDARWARRVFVAARRGTVRATSPTTFTLTSARGWIDPHQGGSVSSTASVALSSFSITDFGTSLRRFCGWSGPVRGWPPCARQAGDPLGASPPLGGVRWPHGGGSSGHRGSVSIWARRRSVAGSTSDGVGAAAS